MMANTTIFAIRRANLDFVLQQLTAQQGFKNGKALCEYYQLSAAEISQFINSQRQMGSKAARAIERQLQLPEAYLDQTQLPALNIGSTQASIPCYCMTGNQQQLFQLELKGQAHLSTLSTVSNPCIYLLQINCAEYEPQIQRNWYALLERQQKLEVQNWVCVRLTNEMAFIALYMGQQASILQFISLDAQRYIELHQEDIVAVDILIAVLTPHQIALLSPN